MGIIGASVFSEFSPVSDTSVDFGFSFRLAYVAVGFSFSGGFFNALSGMCMEQERRNCCNGNRCRGSETPLSSHEFQPTSIVTKHDATITESFLLPEQPKPSHWTKSFVTTNEAVFKFITLNGEFYRLRRLRSEVALIKSAATQNICQMRSALPVNRTRHVGFLT